MNTKHISFTTTDRLTLPGLLYTPAEETKTVTIWLHGMGDSGVFYSPKRITALAEQLSARGIALLAFNNRGAHNSKILYRDDPALSKAEQIYQAGTNFERIADCVADIDGAIDFLKKESYETFYLAGHSTGANKICVYNELSKTNPFSKYVLAGPGDDIGLNYLQLGPKNFWAALQYANDAVAAGKPLKVMPMYSGMQPFSAQSAADILDPDSYYNTFPYYESLNGQLGTKEIFSAYLNITKPMLIIAGSDDEAASTAGGAEAALHLLKKYTNPIVTAKCAYSIVPEADHSFHGAEDEFAVKVASWLK